MKITFADKLIAYLALISGLSISAVAVYYSVAGLVSIFAAAAVPIIVMGVVLELSKLVATVWLKMNWSIAPRLIRLYLFVAVMILMMITSMGIFGYLSKAHLDQAVPTGDVAAKVAILDEKIKTQRDNIEASRKALTQMDTAVDQIMARSNDEKGADKAANLRRSQAKERTTLQNDIARAQKEIAALNEQRAPVAAELRKVEAEVGPIKYIAALVYGDNPDTNVLEKAVRWVIILIVVIFDPLAVILLLASQYSFQWFRRQEENTEAVVEKIKTEPIVDLDKVNSELTDATVIPEPVYPVEETEVEELAKAKAEAKEKVISGDVTALEHFGLKKDETKVVNVESISAVVPVAPPGTPGEAWDVAPAVNSEQQGESTIDKVYRTSAEELAKQKRGRTWFTAMFPTKK